MSDEMSGQSLEVGSSEAAVAPKPRHRIRIVAAAVTAVLLVGAGAGTAIGLSGGSGGNSTPAAAVNALLTAAQNSDLLGALDSIAPGERAAIEPGLVTFIHQMQRLDVLSNDANPSHVAGISFRFSGIETSTQYLEPTIAAVTITHGTMTSAADIASLPLGSFVTSLTGSLTGKPSSSHTGSAATGRSAIVTVNDGGSWYVSLGYTIAADSLRSGGGTGAPPSPSLAVQPTGASTPENAVSDFLDSLAALNLNGMIADLAPGEMGALQSYAPTFLGKANAEISRVRNVVSLKISAPSMSTQPFGSMTLVKVSKLVLQETSRGMKITINGHCTTETYLGHTTTTCNGSGESQSILKLLPANVQAILQRMSHSRPDEGIATVEDNGKWYISPVATLLQSVNAVVGELQPSDLSLISSYAKDPAAAKQELEKIALAILSAEHAGSVI
jgi:hypothetical protein